MRSAGKEHTVLDVREARELLFADWTALCMCRWRRFRTAPMTSRRINCWWSSAIMALAVRWSSTFSENAGFDNAVNLDGGIDAWACDIDQSMPRYR